ncbi:MAG: hypothetical protein KKC72_17100, partial [Alphaproteobacteria bacterium]|nr:hypothetical protein [Alphaproteobacteria bacterium]MBU1836051.1 hypothetical protein [Alphaproteobacteria bacterium]
SKNFSNFQNFQSLNRPSRPLRRVCITASPVKGLLRLANEGRKQKKRPARHFLELFSKRLQNRQMPTAPPDTS